MTPITHDQVEKSVDRAIAAREKACNERLKPIERAIVDIAAMRHELTTAVTAMQVDHEVVLRHDKTLYGSDDPSDHGIAGEMIAIKPVFDGIEWGKKKIIAAAITAITVASAPGWGAAVFVAFKEAIRRDLMGG